MYKSLHFTFLREVPRITFPALRDWITHVICRVMATLTDAFFWRLEESLKNVSFYSSKHWMLMRNWSEKTFFRQLVVTEDNPSELVASNQQNQNRNSGQYVNCNIYQ